MGTLDGKSALITGGAGGFGKACALSLARDGAAVTLMGRKTASLEAAKEWLLGELPSARVALYSGSAIDQVAMEQAVQTTREHGGAIDIVVATVGGGEGYGAVLDLPYASFMGDIEINVGSAFLATKTAVPKMSSGGSIVFISSTAATLSFPGLAGYCAGKAALEHFIHAAANELGSRNIRLNAVRPGLTHTDGMDLFFQNAEYVQGFIPKIPLGRTGVPNDIAAAVRFLAGPESSWVTGQSFAVDGGNELRGAPD